MKKFFIIAGEASGDLLGSKLMKELKEQNPDSQFIGVGGSLMQEQGLKTIFDFKELSIMGFVEVLPKIFRMLSLIKQTANRIIEEKPDYVITIDSPDFCFRVIKKLENCKDFKKIHLIAPSVWAYRENRAEKISKIYDLLLAILPFEPPYFTKYGLKTVFIGHPVVENAPDLSKKDEINLKFRQKYSIKESDKVIILMAGSRTSEVKKIFPEFIESVNIIYQSNKNITIILPLIAKTKDLTIEMAKNLKPNYIFIEGEEKAESLCAGNFALAKSGTNNIEISLYQIPMIIAYKVNFLTHFILKRMVKIKFANLINLILNLEIIPEMLQRDCDSQKIAPKLQKLMEDDNLSQRQIELSQNALKLMGLGFAENPSKKGALEILKL